MSEPLREVAWLVEISGPRYWGGDVWTTDNAKAVRFARKADAEAAMRFLKPHFNTWHDAKAVEHMWVPPPPDGSGDGA